MFGVSMPTTITLKELKAKLKPLGFTVKTCAYSYGRSGWIVRVADAAVMPSIFAGKGQLAQWQPAIDATTNITLVGTHGEPISGPWSGLRSKTE
jgi:hypothetical protein